MSSPVINFLRRLKSRLGPEGSRAALEEFLKHATNVELAALAFQWEFWARPKQLPPAMNWRSWGFLTGRGFGKTLAVSKFVNREVFEGRAKLVCLAAQDELSCVMIQVNGPSGLIATAPPWFRPHFESSTMQVVWPNGARAYVRTPEVPGKIRGLEYHLAWTTELQSWPPSHREEAFSNVLISTRLGYARHVWDATPKRRHPLLKELLEQSDRDPDRHVIVRGTTHENSENLGEGYIDALEAKYGGTVKGREELLGEMLDESENALIKQAWIDQARRPAPDYLTRRVISLDPAVTARIGSDRTGIIDAGLGADGQMYVFADHSARHKPEAWAKIATTLYVEGKCDLIVVETNRGGDLVTQNLRAHGNRVGLNVIILGKDETPRHVPGVIYVREIRARGQKEDRAQPLVTAYERGRVSHVIGAELTPLEDVLTSWEPEAGKRSPDPLDALAHAATELLGLASNRPDPRQAFLGYTRAATTAAAPTAPAITNISRLLGIRPTGGRL